MADPILGRNAILEIKVDDDYYPVLCAIDFTFTTEPEFITKTGPTSGLYREFAKRIEGWGVSLTGLTKILNSESISWFYMLQTAVRRAPQLIRITFEDDDMNTIAISGTALIGAQSITGPVGDFSRATVEFRGTGRYTISDTILSPEELPCEVESTLYKTLAEGATSVTDALLTTADAEIISVTRSGQTHSYTAGTPGSLEFAVNYGTGVVSFDSTNPGNPGGEFVTIIYRIAP